MSRTAPTEVERKMLDERCAYCGAAPGAWCRTRQRPHNFLPLHDDRYQRAIKRGTLPLTDGAA